MLKGKKINLRPIRRDDLKLIYHWMNDLGIKNMIMTHPFPVSDSNVESWYQNFSENLNNRDIYLAIESNENSGLIGYLRIMKIDWISRNAYIGIVIGPEQSRKKGAGSESLSLAKAYVFENLNLHKLYAEICEINIPSIKLFEISGFKSEGKLTDHIFIDGRYQAVFLYAVYNKGNDTQ